MLESAAPAEIQIPAPLRRFGKSFVLPSAVIVIGIMMAFLLFYLARQDAENARQGKDITSTSAIFITSLPYIGLMTSFILTWILFIYLRVVMKRSAYVSELITTTTQTNTELNERIAEEARLSHALQISEQRYSDLFDNAGIGICQIAPSGEWMRANSATAKILGYEEPQELLAEQPDFHGKLFVRKDDRHFWFSKLLDGGQREFEVELYTRDGSRIWAAMSGYTLLQDDGKPSFECTLHDITERRRAELNLIRAKEQADFANRSKSEFLANMSHELRTPLNAIIGFSEIIKGQMFGPVGQAQYVEYAQDIYDSGALLLSLINDILDMSKIEAGKRTLAEATLNVAQIIDSVMRLMTPRVKIGKLHSYINIPIDLPSLRGEEKALKQILTNLLTNAVKFTPEGGNITLSAGIEKNGSMFITVQDTGIGMTAEDIPIALAPFGQIESVLSRKNQGTGLGLPLTKALTELHDGTFEVESKIGTGTTVKLTFPADRVVAKALIH